MDCTLTSGGSANTGLSNLSTTAINQDMLPASDNTKNLGSASSSWKVGYLDGSLYMGGNRFIAYTAPGSTPITAIGEGALINN